MLKWNSTLVEEAGKVGKSSKLRQKRKANRLCRNRFSAII